MSEKNQNKKKISKRVNKTIFTEEMKKGLYHSCT